MFALIHDDLTDAAEYGRKLVSDYPTDPAVVLGASLLGLNPHLLENPCWHLGHSIKHQDTLEHAL